MRRVTEQQRTVLDRHKGIVQLYRSGRYTTEVIAKNYGVSVRQVQRVAKKYGVIRSQAEANKVAAPLKHYRTIPIEARVRRKHLTLKQRYECLRKQPFCGTCGRRAEDGVRLEVDHIDENPQNNAGANLQVLCSQCNTGKSHLSRFKS